MTGLLLTLKILGIVLVSILALVFFLILLLLFVPIRYKLAVAYEEELQLEVKGSFLLHLFGGCFSIMGEKKELIIRILGIPIRLGQKPKGDPKKKPVKKADQKEKKDKEEKKGKKGKKDKKQENTEEKKSFGDIMADIGHYLEIITADYTADFLKGALKTIGKILKSLLPGKCKVAVELGMDDSMLLSEIWSAYCFVFPFIGEQIIFVPVYDRTFFSIKGYMKGSVRLWSILFALIRLLLDKNCRILIRRLKK